MKYNPESHIARSLTGRSTFSETGHPSKHRHGQGGSFGLGAMAHKAVNHDKIKYAKSGQAVQTPKVGVSRPLVDPIRSNSTTKGAPKIGIPKNEHLLHPRIGTTVIDPKKGQLTEKPGATKIAPKPIGKIGTTKVAPKSGTKAVKKVDSAGAKPTAASNGVTTAASAQKAAGTATTAASASSNAVAKGASGAQLSGAKSGGIKTGGIKPAREQSGGDQSGGAQTGGGQSSGSQSGGSAFGSDEYHSEVITQSSSEEYTQIVTEVF